MANRSIILGGAAVIALAALGGCSDDAESPSPTTAEVKDNLQTIRAAAERRMREIEGLPGAVIAVRIGETIDLRLALGHTSEARDEPMTLDHAFRIASAAKPFLGVTALRVAERGVIDLDAPLATLLPDIPHAGDVTLRMLARNTSGYFNAVADPKFRAAIDADPSRLWTASDILAYAMDQPLTLDKPGAGWAYSNTNSVLLAHAIEAATGEHWSYALSREMIEPLGLTSVRVEEPGAPPHLRPDDTQRFPVGYRYAQRDSAMAYGNVYIDASDFSPSWAGAAGSMNATIDDLARAAEPVLMGTVLTPASRDAYHAWLDTGYDSSPGDFSEPASIYYAFHLGKRRIGAHEWIGHTGDVPGYSSFFAYTPEFDASVIVLCNLSNTPRRLNPAEEIAEAIIATLDDRFAQP